MKTPELIWRLRVEGGFAMTPLIDSTGTVTGAHLTRFTSDGHIEVLQVWNEEWAAFTRIPNQLDSNAPLSSAMPKDTRSGRLENVAPPLLKKS